MTSHFLKYKNSDIHYYQYGEGETLLLALPGFANEADIYQKIEGALSSRYTVIAIDLPYHGKTVIREKNFDKMDLIAVFRQLIGLFSEKKNVEIVGYSYGGHLAAATFMDLGVSRLILIATDALDRPKPFHFFPLILRRLVIALLRRPYWFIRFLDFLYKISIVPKYTHRFMTHHLGTPANRVRIFGTWQFITAFKPNRQKVLQHLKQKDIAVLIIYGTDDRIISAEGGLILSKKYPKARVVFVPGGHKIFNQGLIEVLSTL